MEEEESQSEASRSLLQSSPLEDMSLIKAGRRVGVRYLGKMTRDGQKASEVMHFCNWADGKTKPELCS